ALRYAEEQTQAEGQAHRALPNGRHRYFMVFLANGDDPNLVVFPTHRHVHGLPGCSFDELLEKARPYFDVTLESGTLAERPQYRVCAPDGRSAILALRKDADLAAHPTVGKLHPTLRRTDVGLLHAGILEHLLGITKEAQAAKTNLWYPQDGEAALA